jgi:Flp pilus assembly protein TadG
MFRRNDQKGQSLVEVALSLPLLLLILAGILDLGRAYFTYITLSDAAAEGAAYAAVHPSNTQQVIDRAVDSSNDLVIIDPAMVAVDYVDMAPGNPVTVTVSYDYEIITPIINGFVPDGLTLRAVVVQAIINQ